MLDSWKFGQWAQPVTSRTWAIVAAALYALSQASGYRMLNTAKAHAWCRAVNVPRFQGDQEPLNGWAGFPAPGDDGWATAR